MKLSTLMAGYSPSATFKGEVMANDWVLAVDISASQSAAIGDYYVVQEHIESAESSINSTTNDKEYIRSGKSSSKASNQRTFSVSGDRYIGDEAQDFFMSKKYAVGQAAVCKYVYFNLLDGKGETGTVTISVDSDGGGSAGENSTISISLSKTGAAPTDFEWSSISGVYSVTLNANGGTIADGHDVTSYTTGTAVDLPTSTYVTREDYTFDGWYDSETLTEVTTIAATETGDKVYLAKWVET